MEDVSNLSIIGPTNPIQILKQHEFFWRFCMCPSKDTFNKKRISMLVMGLHSKDRKSTEDKANISNLKVNRGCPPLTANCTSADCVQISLRPSIQYIPLRVYHTGGFNALLYPLGRIDTLFANVSLSTPSVCFQLSINQTRHMYGKLSINRGTI